MSGIKIADTNIPKNDEERWVMECTLKAESVSGGTSKRVEFRGFATSEVVLTFLDIARKVVE